MANVLTVILVVALLALCLSLRRVTARYTKDSDGGWQKVDPNYTHGIVCKVCDRGTRRLWWSDLASSQR